MTYQQAGRIAVLKRILGWVLGDFHPDFCRTGVAGFRSPDESPGALLAGRC